MVLFKRLTAEEKEDRRQEKLARIRRKAFRVEQSIKKQDQLRAAKRRLIKARSETRFGQARSRARVRIGQAARSFDVGLRTQPGGRRKKKKKLRSRPLDIGDMFGSRGGIF